MYLWQHLFINIFYYKTYCFISTSSMSHFTSAMFSKLSAQQPSSPAQNTPSSSVLEIEDLEPERKYACPHAGCLKSYRQSSGLRYHRKHVRRCSSFTCFSPQFLKQGHPPDMPAQLPIVPPMLEQHISAKIKKLRSKQAPESNIV